MGIERSVEPVGMAPQDLHSPLSTEYLPLHAMTEESELPHPDRIGQYRILGLLGRGGMGAVFEAEQENPRRTVALKIVTGAVLSDQMRRRFELEAQVLGHLSHPCIAQVYEAGMHEGPGGSQPFFAMELVRGKPLVEYADEHELDTRERLQLMARICDGVQHAHQRGVIHRDLKPANILVDEEGQPKILDFGLARATDSDIQASTLHTDIGQIMGTIPYMSPEQAAGDPFALDLRSDIYSLGVVTYELISGEMPYLTNQVQVLEALRAVQEEDARPLSSIDHSLGGDVETIVGKALEKEPERRYASVSDLASDIRRFLADEPITARPPSTLYQLRKFARRNKLLIGAVAAVFLALVVGLVGTARGYFQARAETERARRTSDFFQTILLGVDPAVAQGADNTLFKAILDDTAARIDEEFEGQPIVEGSVRSAMGSAFFSIAAFDSCLAQARAAHELFVQTRGENSFEAITELRKIGSVLEVLGRTEEAEPLLRKVVAQAEKHLGHDHEETVLARCELGILELSQRRYDEAAALFEPVLAWRRANLDPDHTDVLIAVNCLGLARLEQDRYEEAEALLVEALEGRRRAFGDKHPETIKAVHNLGGLYSTTDRAFEAEDLYRDALERYRRILGPDHPTTLSGAGNLALLLRTWNRIDEALELQRQAYEGYVRTLGKQNQDTLGAESELALILRVAGRGPEARGHAEHATAGLRELFGPAHDRTLKAEANLASILDDQGEGERAQTLRSRVIEGFRQLYGDDHPKTLLVRNDYAVQLIQNGRNDEAEPIVREVLASRRRLLGGAHRETLQSVYALATILHGEGRSEEAAPLLAEFLGGWSAIFGDEGTYVEKAARGLLDDLEQIEDFAPHAESARALLEYHERVRPGDDSPRWLRLRGAQAIEEERFDDAEDLLAGAWESSENLPASERRAIARSFARLYVAQELPEDADFWREEAAALGE